ncbi:MAG: MFS transporter [Pseudomonadota bacterium]
MVSLALCMLLPSLSTSIANVALPTLAVALGASFQQVQWVVLAYLLATTTLIVGVGRLGDLAGRRRLLLAGIFLFSTASVLCGVASGLGLLIAARALQGLGAAVMLALSMAFIGEVVPKAKVGSAMGLLGTMSAAGTALGPTLGGVLIAGFGWRAIFVINLPLGMLALGLALRHLPADRRAVQTAHPGFDYLGTSLLALTLAAYALSMTLGRGSFGVPNVALLAAAALGVWLFVISQRQALSPLLRLALFRDAKVSSGLAMSALVSTVMMATLVVGPFHLSQGLHLDTALVGLAMSVGPIIAALIGVPAGRAVDRFGARHMSILGLAVMALGCIAMCLAQITPGIAGFVIPMASIAAGYALFQAANNTAVMKDASPDQRGVLSGMLNLSRNLGLVTGAAVLGAVFAVLGMPGTFAVAATLIVVALLIAASTPRKPL